MAAYVAQVRRLNPDGVLRHYPGSPQIALQMLRAQDRLALFELHSTESKLLREHFAHAARRVSVRAADGFCGLKAARLLAAEPVLTTQSFAICRIPATHSPKAKRVEFRAPDPTCNPYLAFSAILMAGLDGILNRIDPGQPHDRDLYEMPAEEKKLIQQVPSSLTEVLDALEADHAFLLQGDVFTADPLEEYIKYKRTHEVDAIRLRPTPHEFVMYFDC